MNALSLSSSSNLNISKPLFHHLPTLQHYKHQRPSSLSVSCSATKVSSSVDETATKGNFYKMLSLSPKSATMDDIKRAYRTMALQYHPDVCRSKKEEESTKMFVQLNAAYETLSDPRLRAEYDYELGLIMRSEIMGGSGGGGGDESWRRRWMEQVAELKRRSDRRMAQKEGSWAQNMNKHHHHN